MITRTPSSFRFLRLHPTCGPVFNLEAFESLLHIKVNSIKQHKTKVLFNPLQNLPLNKWLMYLTFVNQRWATEKEPLKKSARIDCTKLVVSKMKRRRAMVGLESTPRSSQRLKMITTTPVTSSTRTSTTRQRLTAKTLRRTSGQKLRIKKLPMPQASTTAR